MKKLFLIAIAVLFSGLYSRSSYLLAGTEMSTSPNAVVLNPSNQLSQQDKKETAWCQKNYDELLAMKDEELQGCLVTELLDQLDERDMKIGHINLMGTSPWDVRTHGRFYIAKIMFYETESLFCAQK